MEFLELEPTWSQFNVGDQHNLAPLPEPVLDQGRATRML
jgi:hypothetical protein